MTLILIDTYSESVDPGRPRVTGHLTEDLMRGCSLHISWIIPESTDISEVTHYAINDDGMNVYNETNTVNETFLSLSYYVQTCTPHNSSVSIFNRCGRAGPPSPNVSTASPQPLVCNDTVCKENTVTGDKFM